MRSAPSRAVVQACADAVFDPERASPKIKAAMLVQHMKHLATAEVRLMSVKMWLHFLSLNQTCLPALIQETYPCFELILQVTGQKAPTGLASAVPCGSGRWCNHCEQALILLSKCAHVPLLTDTLVQLLRTTTEGWMHNNLGFWNPCPEFEAHDCGASCPHA